MAKPRFHLPSLKFSGIVRFHPFIDTTKAPAPPGSARHQQLVQAFREGVARGFFPPGELQWFYDEFHDLVLNHPYPGYVPSIQFFTKFIEQRLLPWTPPTSPSASNPQDLIDNCRRAFEPYYFPHSRFITHARETNPVIGHNADTLTFLMETRQLRQGDLQDIVRHFPMIGWEDKRCTGTETIHELADVIAFYLSSTYKGNLTLPAIVQKLRDIFQDKSVLPFPM
jgi:hypothetical protein